MTDLASLFNEVKEVLRCHQPELKAALLPDRIRIEGTFICRSEAGPFDRFEVEITLSSLFPHKEPSLHEVGGRIPRTVARHVFPSSGRCCLGLWEAWLLKADTADFESYLLGPVTSYFVGQSIFETTDEWPFGEQGHSTEEIATTYCDALSLPLGGNPTEYLRILTAPFLSGNPMCPCGSGARLRNCHWRSIREQRQRIPASVRSEMADRLKGAEKVLDRAWADRSERPQSRRVYPIGRKR
jgi:hypothetical protein